MTTNSKYTKYTEEILRAAVLVSTSYAGVIRYLGLEQAGGTQTHIKNKIATYNIDISHFTGRAHGKGTVSPTRKTPEQIFIVYPAGSARPKVEQLRRALEESGVAYSCELCDNKGEWNGEPLCLEIDHVNGSWLDNRLHNLRYLCPNCHSQTPTSRSWKNTVL